jgi:hypothetical protein
MADPAHDLRQRPALTFLQLVHTEEITDIHVDLEIHEPGCRWLSLASVMGPGVAAKKGSPPRSG